MIVWGKTLCNEAYSLSWIVPLAYGTNEPRKRTTAAYYSALSYMLHIRVTRINLAYSLFVLLTQCFDSRILRSPDDTAVGNAAH